MREINIAHKSTELLPTVVINDTGSSTKSPDLTLDRLPILLATTPHSKERQECTKKDHPDLLTSGGPLKYEVHEPLTPVFVLPG